MIVAITNRKGGVGKTTTAANLGVLLASQGRRVLLVDADPQFALTRQLGIEERSLGVNNLGLLTVNALVLAELVVAPVSAEDEESFHGIRELRRTVRRLADRLDRPALEIVAILTRWAPQRVSSRAIEHALMCEGLTPAARIPARSALFARAAADRVPLAVSDRDSSPAIAYEQLAAQITAVSAR